MGKKKPTDRRPAGILAAERGPAALIVTLLLAALLSLLVIVLFGGSYKLLTLIACALLCLAAIVSGGKPRWRTFVTPVTLALLAYVVYCGIGRTYALSGKFFLQEYSKLLLSFALYAALGLSIARQRTNARRIAALFSAAAALFTVLSVEAASTGIVRGILEQQKGYAGLNLGFEAGTRMTGIFGNANILAGALAIGTLLSLSLLQSSETAGERFWDTCLLGVNAYGFLLAFSMGATAALGAACVVYLIFAGKEQRIRVFFRMVETVLCALAGVFAAFPSFANGGPLPLLLLVLVPVILWLLDRFVCDRLVNAIGTKGGRVLLIVVLAAALALAYLAAGLTVTGGYTFGEGITRSLYPPAGENSIQKAAWNGDVKVRVRSQNSVQVMLHTDTTLYSGPVESAAFTVPEDAVVVHFDLSGSEGSVLVNASLATGEKIPLRYKLLPGFIANRLQGLRTNQNAIQRTVFFEDGIRLFGKSPVFGNGMGSFETAIFGVQSFYYETKYVHNNYIQVLLDGGILGELLYLSVLGFAAWALLRKKRPGLPPRLSALHPALCAGLVFLLIHSAVEVTMSTLVFLPYAAALFALISGLCDLPLAELKRPAAKAAPGTARICTAALCGVFAVLIGLNIYAYKRVTGSLSDINAYYKALSSAVKSDPFESIDYHLSYVANANQSPENSVYAQRAAPHAEKLAVTNSNATAPAVIQYYVNQSDLPAAARAADHALRYNRASPQRWNTYLSLLAGGVFSQDQIYSYSGEDGKALAETVHGIAEFLQETNRTLLAPVTVDNTLAAFLDLNEVVFRNGIYEPASVYAPIFDSRSAFDFDGNGAPELLTVKGGTDTEGGGFHLDPGGTVTLEATLPYGGGTGYRLTLAGSGELEAARGDVPIALGWEDGVLLGGLMPENPGSYLITITAPEGAEIESILLSRD